ncbi:MAG TPA: hypothetical protein VGX48_11790 [Pyrinomonadaceae bacterium]|jgi:hypothetical protein|nr:hypothetical protein [Pyrinomonadaceae bacterium]
MRHTIQWMAPSPLWAEAAVAPEGGAVRKALRQPALLRFSTDTFMEDFAATLEHQPARLADFLALPETWREPSDEPDPLERAPEFLRKLGRAREAVNRTLEAANRTSTQTAARGAAQVLGRAPVSSKLPAANKLALAKTAAAAKPLKLYQPAHQRFYLVTAALVCRVAGLPDYALDTARDERVGYVVRRLVQPEPPKNGPAPPVEEHAFVVSASGQGWQKVTGAAEELVEDEELLPLFPFNFGDTDGRRRRLFGAMIPVGRREAYMGAGPYTPPAGNGAPAQGTTRKTARKIHFRMIVAEPWKNLLRTAQDVTDILNDKDKKPTTDESKTLIKESREQSQMISWYLLLDFAKYLKQYLPDVWSAVAAGSKDGLNLAPASVILYDELARLSVKPDLKTKLTDGTKYKDTHVPASLREALQLVGNPAKDYETKLESNTDPYNRNSAVGDNGWPDFIFPLADPELPDRVPLPSANIAEAQPGDESKEEVTLSTEGVKQALVDRQKLIDNLVALVVRALPADSREKAPRPPVASQPVLDTREGNFVIRCVFERPFCGPLDPPVVSQPSAVFQLAGFFDSDAPARPIRIALPIDTSPAGLRKFDKNTAFMISDVLCGQMQRLKGITFGDLVLSVLPWPFHKDLSVKAPQLGPCKSGSNSLGMICTFSLPIITICAMILLMIIVLLFDFIFRWIPFFIMCFPLPKFKGKR